MSSISTGDTAYTLRPETLPTYSLQRFYTYELLVERIHCQTEELLAEVESPEDAYRLVKVRAGR